MKIDRLLGILTTLLRREKVTAPYLAEKFEVSRRTINRDIEALCLAGIPIATEQGRTGGISIAPGYKLDKELLTEDELQAILMGLRGVDSVSEQPKRKKLEEKLGRPSVRSQDPILIDLASFYKDSLTEKIALLQKSIGQNHFVSFCYYSEKGEETRRVEPYLVVFQWSSWYLFAFCTGKQDFRMFKLSRLWELRLDNQSFSPRELPENRLDFNQVWEENYRLEAVIEPCMKYRLVEEYGPDSFSQRPDGSLFFSRDFTFYNAMLTWVLAFGIHAEVLSPPELREDLWRMGKLFSQRYSKRDT